VRPALHTRSAHMPIRVLRFVSIARSPISLPQARPPCTHPQNQPRVEKVPISRSPASPLDRRQDVFLFNLAVPHFVIRLIPSWLVHSHLTLVHLLLSYVVSFDSSPIPFTLQYHTPPARCPQQPYLSLMDRILEIFSPDQLNVKGDREMGR
jgi:hypothetical protein